MDLGWNKKLIRAIGESGYTLEDISYLTGVREPDLHQILRNEEKAGDITKAKLAFITGRDMADLFPPNGDIRSPQNHGGCGGCRR